MKSRFLGLSLTVGFAMTIGTTARAASAPIGAFRGYETVSQVLRQRLLDPADPATGRFELGVFLGTRDPQGLPALLGGFSGSGPDMAYRSGVPNAMNSAVWYLVVQRLTSQLSSFCENPDVKLNDAYALSPDLKELLRRLCAWPVTSDADIDAYFDRLMGAFAPPAEKALWRDFVNSMRALPADPALGATVVKAASDAALLHPYFLLSN